MVLYLWINFLYMGENMKIFLTMILIFSMSAFAQEEESRESAPGVIELTVVKVKTNFIQDYLDGLELTWVAAHKIQQEMGIIDNYNVYVGNNSYVYLSKTYPNYAAMDPWTDEQQAEFEEKYRKIISESDQTSTAQGYEDIRETVRVEMLDRILFK